MSTARSAFTEAIEDHLALKKQNSALEQAMPLARYDVGDPLDRYPGGPNRAADGTMVIAEDVTADASAFESFSNPLTVDAPDAPAAAAAAPSFGPSPEQAMEAATALEHAFGDRPFEPLNGLAPMLSLVEDIDEDEQGGATGSIDVVDAQQGGTDAISSHGDVLRFPGGVGPRDEQQPQEPQQEIAGQQSMIEDPTAAAAPVETHAFGAPAAPAPATPAADEFEFDAPTGEQPVLVIDADEPRSGADWSEPAAPARSSRRSKPRFFGIGRKKAEKDAADGWFTDGPRDFNWD